MMASEKRIASLHTLQAAQLVPVNRILNQDSYLPHSFTTLSYIRPPYLP
jgi:hypothetical protein